MGDQPSGVRAGFLLLKGVEGINQNAMGGYLANDNSVMIIGDNLQQYKVVKDKTKKSKK